jgi:hypothetical protein
MVHCVHITLRISFKNLKVCDNGKLVQILRSWTLSIVLSLFKMYCLCFKTQLLETGFYLCLQVKPTQLDQVDRASPYLRTPVIAAEIKKLQFHQV